jgi:transcriptional regulator with XRE-family HTH domain
MENKMMLYNGAQHVSEGVCAMPKKKILTEETEGFGERLAKLRKAAGFSLRELAAEIGISHRMLVHYEKHGGHPSAQLLPTLAKALHVSTDELMGTKQVKENGKSRDNRLWRRFAQVEKLPPSQRRPIIQFIDAFLGNTAKKVG